MAKRKTNQQFLSELEVKNPNVQPMEKYNGSATPIRCKCACGNDDWYPTPSNLLRGEKCGECAGVRRALATRLSNEKFISEVKKSNPNIKVLGTYEGLDRRIRCKCIYCSHEWNPIAGSIYKGSGCPQCKKRTQSSFPEQAIFYYLRKKYVTCINSYKDGFGRSELDIYIPELKLGIEYDGRNWHKHSKQIEEKNIPFVKTEVFS